MELEKERKRIVCVMKHTSYFFILHDSATDAKEEGKVAILYNDIAIWQASLDYY